MFVRRIISFRTLHKFNVRCFNLESITKDTPLHQIISILKSKNRSRAAWRRFRKHKQLLILPFGITPQIPRQVKVDETRIIQRNAHRDSHGPRNYWVWCCGRIRINPSSGDRQHQSSTTETKDSTDSTWQLSCNSVRLVFYQHLCTGHACLSR